jgi:hypothetical protein
MHLIKSAAPAALIGLSLLTQPVQADDTWPPPTTKCGTFSYQSTFKTGCSVDDYLSDLHSSTDQRSDVQKSATDRYTAVQKKRWQTLFDADRHYGFLKYCNETRKGYLVQWVNDVELDRARSFVKRLEDEAKEVWGDELDADRLYKSALTYLDGLHVDGPICHRTYLQMLQIRDASGRAAGSSLTEKDF